MRKGFLLTQLALAAVGGAALGTLAGCDNDAGAANKRAAASVEQGQSLLSAGKVDEAAQHFRAADGETAAEPEMRIHGKLTLATTELEKGQAALDQLRREESQIARLIWEMGQIAEQIQTNNLAVQSMRRRDPAPTLDQLQQRVSEAQGAGDQPTWLSGGEADLPALGALRQEIARLEGEIAALQEQTASLQAQREQALQQADEQAVQAERHQGQASVDAFSSASGRRKHAADLSTQLEVVSLQLIPLEADLEVARQQQAVLERAIAGLQQQRQQEEQEWSEVQEQIQSLSSLSNSLVEGSLATKAAELDQHVQLATALRQAADESLGNAAASFAEAASEADKMINDRRQAKSDAQAKGWTEADILAKAESIHSPAAIRLGKADALRALAAMHAQHASLLSARQRMLTAVNASLAEAGLMPPPQLADANLEAALAQARQSADLWYAQADEELQSVAKSPGASEAARNASHLNRMYMLYGWAQFKRDAGAAEEAEALLQQAVTERDYATEQNLSLGVLPEGLAPPPKPAGQPAQPQQAKPPAKPANGQADPTSELYQEANQPTGGQNTPPAKK